MHTAASNKVVKMSVEAPRQHTPPGSCCLPGAHLQIICSGRSCQSALSVSTVYIKFWVKVSNILHKELGINHLESVGNIVVFEFNPIEQNLKHLFYDLNVWMDYCLPHWQKPRGPLTPWVNTASVWSHWVFMVGRSIMTETQNNQRDTQNDQKETQNQHREMQNDHKET